MDYYLITTIIVFLELIVFIFISDKKVLFYPASFFMFSVISNLGNLYLSQASTVEEALLANKLLYLGSCALPLFLFMLVCDACKISLPKPLRSLMFLFNCFILILSQTAGYTNWFYNETSIEKTERYTVLLRSYSWGHTFFLIMIYGYLLTGISILIYSLATRRNLIYRDIVLMVFIYASTVISYAFGRQIFHQVDPIPVSYCINGFLLLFISYRSSQYNLDEAFMASVNKQDNFGFLLFDKHYHYLGCNDVAIKFIPSLEKQRLGKKISVSDNTILGIINKLVMEYDGTITKEIISKDDIDLAVSIQYMYKINKKIGYIIQIADDTKQQNYIRQLDTISQNKSNFLSNVSHEIRTPINAILAMNEMILRESDDNTIKEYASNADSASKMLLQIINDILDFSKIEAGKFDIIPVEYHLADIIADLENMMRPLVEKKDLSFHIKLSDKLPQTLYGDANRIRQMITNLLTNAVKYTEKGSVTMEVSGVTQNNQFIFSYKISDTGKGIKKEDMDKLFTSYNRFDSFENNGIEGTGLGLAITKKFAEMMYGTISVESTYKKGSTFTITIPQDIVDATPMNREQKNQTTRAAYKELFHAPTAKILVVDDTPMNLTVVQALLKQTQVQITTCSSGMQCLDILEHAVFDLILLDHMMPDFDGIDTYLAIRQEHYCDNTPIIALSANANAGIKEYYQEIGFCDYLSKPLVPEVLEQLIMKYLPEDKLLF